MQEDLGIPTITVQQYSVEERRHFPEVSWWSRPEEFYSGRQSLVMQEDLGILKEDFWIPKEYLW